MTRREQREQIFKLLFRVEFNDLEEMKEQCSFFFDDSLILSCHSAFRTVYRRGNHK